MLTTTFRLLRIKLTFDPFASLQRSDYIISLQTDDFRLSLK